MHVNAPNLALHPSPAERLESWKSSYQITNDVDAHLLRELVSCSLLLDQAREEERALLRADSLNARHNWESLRHLDAVKIGARLSRNPELIALKLRQTKQGVDWLLTRWNHLADLLKRGESWTDKQRKLALDLTGAPADLRAPANIILDPAALAKNEIATLTALRDGPLADLDHYARECSLDGKPLDPSRPLQSARRRHAALARLFQATDKLLRSKPSPKQTSTPPQPLPKPVLSIPTLDPPLPLTNHNPKPRTFAPSTPSPSNRRDRRAAESLARRQAK